MGFSFLHHCTCIIPRFFLGFFFLGDPLTHLQGNISQQIVDLGSRGSRIEEAGPRKPDRGSRTKERGFCAVVAGRLC